MQVATARQMLCQEVVADPNPESSVWVEDVMRTEIFHFCRRVDAYNFCLSVMVV
jgi:hypothetical protein